MVFPGLEGVDTVVLDIGTFEAAAASLLLTSACSPPPKNEAVSSQSSCDQSGAEERVRNPID